MTRLLAIDLDDTLLGRTRTLSDANRRAIERAVAAGWIVVPCTGRVWHKAKQLALDHLPTMDLGVFLDGSMVCDVPHGSIRRSTTMPDRTAAALLDWFGDPAFTMVYCRRTNDTDYGYLVRGRGPTAECVTATWLGDVAHRVVVDGEAADDDVRNTLGVRVVAENDDTIRRAETILAQAGDAAAGLTWHVLWFVQGGLSVMQIYDQAVDKWPAVVWIAEQHNIAVKDIAFIGDQINDVRSLRQAGCGIAMANAVDAAKQAADYVTTDCDEDGVAHAIDQLLSGIW